jgi:hypothetical protein
MQSNVTCRLKRVVLLALLLAGTVNFPVRGQGVAAGRIKGSVRDQSGDIVAGVSVVARGELTDASKSEQGSLGLDRLTEPLPLCPLIHELGSWLIPDSWA